MDTFTAPVLNFPRFVLWFPALVVVAGIVLGQVLYQVVRLLSWGQTLGGILAVASFILAIPVAIMLSKSRSGELVVTDRAVELHVKGKLRKTIELDRARSSVHVWQKGFVQLTVGVVLVLEGDGETLAVGATDTSLIGGPVSEDADITYLPPTVTIDGGLLSRLIDRVGAESNAVRGR